MTCVYIELANKIKNDFIDKQKPFDNESLKILAQDIYKRSYPEKNNFKVSIGWCTDFKKRWTFSSIKISKTGISNNDDDNIEIE